MNKKHFFPAEILISDKDHILKKISKIENAYPEHRDIISGCLDNFHILENQNLEDEAPFLRDFEQQFGNLLESLSEVDEIKQLQKRLSKKSPKNPRIKKNEQNLIPQKKSLVEISTATELQLLGFTAQLNEKRQSEPKLTPEETLSLLLLTPSALEMLS